MIDRKKVSEYFTGKSQRGPILMMIVGLITVTFTFGLLILLGLIWLLVNIFTPDYEGEAEVDLAKEHEIELAKQRALDKLNIVDEQVQNVAPVVVTGRGFQPEYVAGVAAAKKAGGLGKAIKRFFGLDSVDNTDYDDPYFMARIGIDGRYRCSLISTSVFMFGEKQLFIYFSNVDLTTGIVYSEGTHEYFYSDINALTFLQNKEKVYNFKTKRYEGILFECVQLFASGCSHTATLFTDLDKSVIEKEFNGMRALIRERKDA